MTAGTCSHVEVHESNPWRPPYRISQALMANTNLVRPSRDGDQFHYLWAARRCLKLLSAEPIQAGEELIDIAEYFGSENIDEALLVRYMQLKHSTLHANDPWTASGLEKTIRGFAKRFAELQRAHAQANLAKKLEFWFVTNRPISTDVVEAIADAAACATPRHKANSESSKNLLG
jgi:hypothetical protein